MGSTWRDMVAGFAGARLNPPASADRLGLFATDFGRAGQVGLLPLLIESDGVAAPDGAEVVWSASRIAATANLAATDELLFFGDNGKGDRFALLGSSERGDIWLWDHRTGAHTWVAPGLWPFLRRMLRGDGDDWCRQDLASLFE